MISNLPGKIIFYYGQSNFIKKIEEKKILSPPKVLPFPYNNSNHTSFQNLSHYENKIKPSQMNANNLMYDGSSGTVLIPHISISQLKMDNIHQPKPLAPIQSQLKGSSSNINHMNNSGENITLINSKQNKLIKGNYPSLANNPQINSQAPDIFKNNLTKIKNTGSNISNTNEFNEVIENYISNNVVDTKQSNDASREIKKTATNLFIKQGKFNKNGISKIGYESQGNTNSESQGIEGKSKERSYGALGSKEIEDEAASVDKLNIHHLNLENIFENELIKPGDELDKIGFSSYYLPGSNNKGFIGRKIENRKNEIIREKVKKIQPRNKESTKSKLQLTSSGGLTSIEKKLELVNQEITASK